MSGTNRRQFLKMGSGVVLAGAGVALADQLGLASVFPGAMLEDLNFGELEVLADQMQQLDADRLQAQLVKQVKSGTEISTIVAAAALANARTFGGHDYDGYHIQMALIPAYEMSSQMPRELSALPVLKVVHRNSRRIQDYGGRRKERLHAVQAKSGDVVREMRERDLEAAEGSLVRLSQQSVDEAYNRLQEVVQDDLNVHRVVLSWRVFDALRLTGNQHAGTMMRQSLRFCIDEEAGRIKRGRDAPAIRKQLPQLLDRYELAAGPKGKNKADDLVIEGLSDTIYGASREEAAQATAEALGKGYDPKDVGEALSLAANRLLMHDPGRNRDESMGRYKGSVHGASVGVHASDAANAWRHISQVSNPRNQAASLIVGAFHTAGQSVHTGRKPFYEGTAAPTESRPSALRKRVLESVRQRDQAGAVLATMRYGQVGGDPEQLFAALLEFAVEADGALHAEKYFRTAQEEFVIARPAFRWRHAHGMARVCASQYGMQAPGVEQARRLLEA